MENQTKINGGLAILIILAAIASVGLNPTDNIYYGTDGLEVTCQPIECFKLSKVNDYGISRNCYYNEDEPRRYKICPDGWIKFENIQAEEIKINLSKGEQIYLVCTKTNELISECQVIDKNQTLFKIGN